MSHWLAYRLGQISISQARRLQGLKNAGKMRDYETEELDLGATTAQLVRKYGREAVQSEKIAPYRTKSGGFRTNPRTRKRYPLQHIPRSIFDSGPEDYI